MGSEIGSGDSSKVWAIPVCRVISRRRLSPGFLLDERGVAAILREAESGAGLKTVGRAVDFTGPEVRKDGQEKQAAVAVAHAAFIRR